MKNENKQVKSSTADVFTKKVNKLPDLAKSYLFQVTFATLVKNRQTKEYELVNNDKNISNVIEESAGLGPSRYSLLSN